MKPTTVALGVGLLLIAVTAGAGPPINVLVSPRMSFEPTTLLISVIAERDNHNRIMRVTAESEDFAESSERQLDGESSPRFASFRFEGVPAGEYEIRAMVFGSDGRVRAQARVSAKVISTKSTGR